MALGFPGFRRFGRSGGARNAGKCKERLGLGGYNYIKEAAHGLLLRGARRQPLRRRSVLCRLCQEALQSRHPSLKL